MTVARIKMTLLIDGKFVNHQQSCVCVTIITLLYPFAFWIHMIVNCIVNCYSKLLWLFIYEVYRLQTKYETSEKVSIFDGCAWVSGKRLIRSNAPKEKKYICILKNHGLNANHSNEYMGRPQPNEPKKEENVIAKKKHQKIKQNASIHWPNYRT